MFNYYKQGYKKNIKLIQNRARTLNHMSDVTNNLETL